MHTLPVLQRFCRDSFPGIHARRLEALTLAVDAVTQGARVSITSLGRSLDSPVRIKHCVKRMDRLVGNPLLAAQREHFYQAMLSRLLVACPHPMVLI